jgi:PRTRC genetic system protein A
MFKVVMKDGSKLPDDRIFYIVAKNGVFLKKKVGIVDSLTKVSGISFLQDVKPYAKLDIPKIPLRTFGKIMTFFRKIYELHRSECNAILYYNEETKKFRTVIPPQEVSGASVKYIRLPAMEGYVRLSTIHSHPGFTAFHSTTDKSDENDSDGLHITVGKIDEEVFEVAASIVVGKSRFKVEPEKYVEGIKKVEIEEEAPFQRYQGYFSHGYEDFGEIDYFPFASSIPTIKEGYVFTKWSKKFNRFNPNWIFMVKPSQIVYTPTVMSWRSNQGEFSGGYTTVRDILPEPGDVKTSSEEVIQKKFIPCENCAYKEIKLNQEPKKVVEECHGSQPDTSKV